MSDPESIAREELLELASLEAMGVLDEVDCARLNRIFHTVPAALQSEVRALQASIAADAAIGSEEEPSTQLRGIVLTRVRDEMAAEQASLAPIASIGPRRGAVAGSASEQAIEIVQLRAATEIVQGEARRWNRAAVMWRAASIVAGALLIVSLYYNLASNFYAVRISQLALDANAREALIAELGPGYREFAESGCLVRGMSTTKAGFSGSATAFVNRKSGDAMIIAFGLPERIPFTVRLVAENGTMTEVGSLNASGNSTALRIDGRDGFQLAFARWEIVDPNGVVVLQS